jgi:protein gp37
VFVCIMSDLFHARVPEPFIAEVIANCENAPQHTFLFCTAPERAARMADVLSRLGCPGNVWPGTSVSCQADMERVARRSDFHNLPSRQWWISAEPLTGPVELLCAGCGENERAHHAPDQGGCSGFFPAWVAVGGESGPEARPCDAQWVRSLLQQAKRADIPVHVKQLGRHAFDSSITVDVDRATMRAKTGNVLKLKGSGANASEWPSDLVVRELPWTLRKP